MENTSTRPYKKAIIRHKAYFEKGMGLLSYGKYIVAALGLASSDMNFILLIGSGFAISCYLLGIIWIKKGFYEEESNFNNEYNPQIKQLLKNTNNTKNNNKQKI